MQNLIYSELLMANLDFIGSQHMAKMKVVGNGARPPPTPRSAPVILLDSEAEKGDHSMRLARSRAKKQAPKKTPPDVSNLPPPAAGPSKYKRLARCTKPPSSPTPDSYNNVFEPPRRRLHGLCSVMIYPLVANLKVWYRPLTAALALPNRRSGNHNQWYLRSYIFRKRS